MCNDFVDSFTVYYRRVVWPGCCHPPTKSNPLCESRTRNKLIYKSWLIIWLIHRVTVWLNRLYCCCHSWRSRLIHCAVVYFWYQRITNSCSVRYTCTHTIFNILKWSKSAKNSNKNKFVRCLCYSSGSWRQGSEGRDQFPSKLHNTALLSLWHYHLCPCCCPLLSLTLSICLGSSWRLATLVRLWRKGRAPPCKTSLQ